MIYAILKIEDLVRNSKIGSQVDITIRRYDMTKPEERRDGKRIQPTVRRQVQIYSRHGKVLYAHFAEVVNLSESGVCVKSGRELSPGGQLQVFLNRQGTNRSFQTEGKVIWKKPDGRYAFQFGVEFMPERRNKQIVREKLKDIMATYEARSTMLPQLFDE